LAEKELRRMNRTELIEIIYALQQNKKTLREENEKLRHQLKEKLLRMENAGSIAEAALSLHHIFEDAQDAASQYLESLQYAHDNADKIVDEARIQAKQVRAAADAYAREQEKKSRAMYQEGMQAVEEERNIFARKVKRFLQDYPELARLMQEKN